MKARALRLAVVLVIASSFFVATAGADELEQLGFLAGAWTSGGQIVEYWMPPLRGLMVGINRAPEGDGTPFFEYLRIEQRADGAVLIASPNGRGTTEFALTEISGSKAVFENPEHDFPQKITYTRTGDVLEAEVGGPHAGEWSASTLRWTRSP